MLDALTVLIMCVGAAIAIIATFTIAIIGFMFLMQCVFFIINLLKMDWLFERPFKN